MPALHPPEQLGLFGFGKIAFAIADQVVDRFIDDRDRQSSLGIYDPLIKDDLKLRASAGVSVFWRSPMGPIQFDFSRILAKAAYDKTETFRFSTSTRF